ncbi:hypothetical protein [Methylomonas sp. AM2-LC]|uniref:hypothetical protein n=1 Tax=Methylomonas sp. AM2-LC TaxID=3153301 RepID=UPI003263F5E6
MKTIIALSLSLSVTLFSALVPGNEAFAGMPTVENGSSCEPYYGSQATQLDHYTGAHTNTGMWVTCPLTVTHTSGTTTGYIYIDTNFPSASYCYLTSYSYTGVSLGYKYQAIAAGVQDTMISSVPANEWSSHSVYCFVPTGGIIFDTASFF